MELEKAYDFKGLGLHFKDKGLDMAEEAVMLTVDAVLDWLEESAKLSENKYDDLALIATPQLRTLLKDLADKIDGEDDIA